MKRQRHRPTEIVTEWMKDKASLLSYIVKTSKMCNEMGMRSNILLYIFK